MTDERDKPSGAGASVPRVTARDVPFARDAGSDAEPAPLAQRPGALPRDPTYEQELADVELAVLRDPLHRGEPRLDEGRRRVRSPGVGREGHVGKVPGDHETPESPGAQAAREARQSGPDTPNTARAAASGTLLSVGGVDPRGNTERALETPRMFFTQADMGAEAYFRPGKIPAVTVHPTIENETVKLSESINPRRAKTIPRLNRAALARLAESEGDSEESSAASQGATGLADEEPHDASIPHWEDSEWTRDGAIASRVDGQIHASLSPFREQAAPESDFTLDQVPTRAEPLARSRVREPIESDALAAPDPSTVPTQRDLPAHRLALSQPAAGRPSNKAAGDASTSYGPSPITASIAAGDAEPEPRSRWTHYAAFLAALVFAVVAGMYVTRRPAAREPAAPPPSKQALESASTTATDSASKQAPEPASKQAPATSATRPSAAPAAAGADASASVAPPAPAAAPPPSIERASRAGAPKNPKPPSSNTAAHKPALPSAPSKSPRETIF